MNIQERIKSTRYMLHAITQGFTPWLDASDAKQIVPVLDEAADTISTLTARVEALEAERTNIIATKREQIERLTEEKREDILSAAKAEREACAEIARTHRLWGTTWQDNHAALPQIVSGEIATAIRQRSEKQ